MQPAAFFCVDWGTTSFRLWALAENGCVVAERQNRFGMSALRSDEPAGYEAILESALSELDAPRHIPVVICGMAGAVGGWREAPYLDVPVALKNAVPKAAVRAPSARRDIRILPGLAQRDAPDVLRGEETLLLGAMLKRQTQGVVCLPGTHCKWARIEADKVTGFCTAMTGEIFALLAEHSTLARYVSSASTVVANSRFADLPAFSEAVFEAMDAPQRALSALFSVRARGLLVEGAHTDELSARLSGLLIGFEIAGMKTTAGDSVTLICDGALAENYRRAFATAAVECEYYSAAEMACAGLYHAAQSLWPARDTMSLA